MENKRFMGAQAYGASAKAATGARLRVVHEISARLLLAVSAAKQAGAVTLQHAGRSMLVEVR